MPKGGKGKGKGKKGGGKGKGKGKGGGRGQQGRGHQHNKQHKTKHHAPKAKDLQQTSRGPSKDMIRKCDEIFDKLNEKYTSLRVSFYLPSPIPSPSPIHPHPPQRNSLNSGHSSAYLQGTISNNTNSFCKLPCQKTQ